MAVWHYHARSVEGGTRRSASVESLLAFDIDRTGLHRLRLEFADDPVWGPACRLHLEAGDFHCPVGCQVQVGIDDAPTRKVQASRPQGERAQLSLREPRELWSALRDARLFTFVFRSGQRRAYRVSFEVTGLDRSVLDWDTQRHAELSLARRGEAARHPADPTRG